MPRQAFLYILFLFSGFCGLVYQVVWVRQFGLVFGNTVESAALVTGVFTGGLGVGSALAGRWADRQHAAGRFHGVRAYGWCELGIAALALLLLPALDQLPPVVATWSGYVATENGWWALTPGSRALRFILAAALLFPVTVLMGATLVLLIRSLVTETQSGAGAGIGRLYAVNTVGAAAGCVLTDFVLVPWVGVTGTVVAAAVLNCVVGGCALLVARNVASPGPLPAAVEPAIPTAHEGDVRVGAVALALVLSGAVAMAAEIVWFRFLSAGLGAYRAVFALLLGVLLAGIALGTVLCGALLRRGFRPVVLYAAAQASFAVLFVSGVMWGRPRELSEWLVARLAGADPGAFARVAEVAANLAAITVVLGPCALLLGFGYPCANAVVQQAASRLAGRAGWLYLCNTAGNIVGAWTAGFIMLPALGIQVSTLMCGVGALGTVVILALSSRAAQKPLAVLLVVATAGVLWFSALPADHVIRGIHANGPEPLLVAEGVEEIAAIARNAEGGLRLYTNGHSMSGTSRAGQRYMRAMAHVPLLMQPEPARALVICFGVGNTVHAVAQHPSVTRVDLVDISSTVLSLADHFTDTNFGVIHDPRLHVYVNDGRNHLLMTPSETYDLVTLEPPPIAHAGVSALYAREFYQLARSRMKDGGLLSQWVPAIQLQGTQVLELVRAFVDVFPDTVLLMGTWQQFILVGRRNASVEVDAPTLRARLEARPGVQHDLRRFSVDTAADVLAMFMADGPHLVDITAGVRPVSDAFPTMEYSQVSTALRTTIPAELFHAQGFDRWCPTCLVGEPLPRGLQRLRDVLALDQRIGQSAEFLETRTSVYAGSTRPDSYRLPTGEDVEATLAENGWLTASFPSGPRWRRRAQVMLEQGEPTLALSAAMAASQADPADTEARELVKAALKEMPATGVESARP